MVKLILQSLFCAGLFSVVALGNAENPLHRKELGPPQPQNNKNGNGASTGEEDAEDEDESDLRPEVGNPNRIPSSGDNGCPLPTVDAFVQMASHSRPQVSPDGALYFVSDLRESPQLYTISRPLQWPKQLTFFPDGLRYFSLSPDGTKVLLAADTQGNEQYDIFLFQTKERTLTPLLTNPQKRVESVVWSSDSKWFAFTSNERNQVDFDLYRFDLATQKATLLKKLQGHHTVSDISSDGLKIALVEYRSVTDSDILLAEAKPKEGEAESKPLFTAENPSTSDLSPLFTKDGKAIFFLSDRSNGKHQLFRLSLDSREVASEPKPLTSEVFPVESFEMDSGKANLVYLVNRNGVSELGGFSVDARGQKKKMLVPPKIQNRIISSLSVANLKSGTTLFYASASATEPSAITSWNHPKQTAWTQSFDGGVPGHCLTPAKEVHYPSFDEMKVPAYLYLPEKRSTPLPFLVYVHGGPESQFRPGFNKVFQYFLSRGFGILAPNIRGSTGYGRDYTLKDNYKLRMDSVRDVVEGARWLTKQKLARPEQIGIFGGSYGGFLVLRAIQLEPTLFGAASESVGISNFVSFLKNTKPYRKALREIEYGPLEDEPFLKSISPITYAHEIKTPLQIFHGANDARVPVNETEQLVEILKKRGVYVESRVFADEGHSTLKLRNFLEQTKLMAYFFEKHLLKDKGQEKRGTSSN